MNRKDVESRHDMTEDERQYQTTQTHDQLSLSQQPYYKQQQQQPVETLYADR